MSETIVVSSAGGANHQEFGASAVDNASIAATPLGMEATKWGNALTQPLTLAQNCAFDFVLLAIPPPDNTYFFFGDGQGVAAKGEEAAAFGRPVASNTSAAITPAGSDYLKISPPTAFQAGAASGNFQFSSDLPILEKTPGSLNLFFGPSLAITNGADAAVFGVSTVETALQLLPFGWESTAIAAPSASFDYAGRLVSFNLANLSVNSPNLYFGSSLVISHQQGQDSSLIGEHNIRNAAQGVFVEGINARNVGIASVFGAGYRGTSLDFRFAQAYSLKPNGNSAPFYFGSAKNIQPHWVGATLFGAHAVSNLAGSISPDGIRAVDIPQPTIINANFYVYCGGIPPTWVFSHADIKLRNSYINPGQVASMLFGQHHIAWERQYVSPVQIQPSNMYGSLWVSRSPRSVAPVSIFTEFFTRPTVGFHRSAQPVGFDASVFGQTAVRDNSQTIYPQGWEGVIPPPEVFNWTQYVTPDGFKSHPNDVRWGWPALHNSRQYVTHYHEIPEIEWQGEVFGKWLSIENWIRRIGTAGVTLSRYGYPFVYNNARLVAPASINSIEHPLFYKSGEVSNYRRYIATEGMDAPYVTRWTQAYNAARPIFTSGEVHSLFGDVLTEDRSVRVKGFDTHFVSGQAFIAPRIRGVEQRWPCEAPTIPLPKVALWTRYIEPKGVIPKQVGNAALTIHRNDIGAHGSQFMVCGQPTVWNYTPEVHTLGYNHAEFGEASIRTQWRTVLVFGADSQLHGVTKIKDRRQWIENVTIPLLPFGNTVVTRIGAEPPSERKIVPLSFPDDGWLGGQVSRPYVGAQSSYPEGFVSTLFGGTRITSNVIRVEPGTPFPYPREGPIVSLKNRIVNVDTKGIDSTIVCGKPRLSPWTIYACVEATQKAIENHDARQLHYIGYDLQGIPQFGVGSPTITLQHRTVKQLNVYPYNDHLRAGTPDVSLWIRSLAPVSFRPFRMGAHAVIGGVQEPFTVEGIPPPDPAFGAETTVAFPVVIGPRHLYPSGLAGAFGNTEIQLKNRTIVASGFYSTRTGASSGESFHTYMHQNLFVGFPDNPPMQGWDSSVIGDSWTSLWIRGIEPEGFDATDTDYDVLAFDKRMSVKNVQTDYQRRMQTMLANGSDCSVHGYTSVANHVQVIRPDGNADTYRQGVH